MDEIIRTTKDFGDVMRKVRKAQGLTQADLAGITGVSRRLIVELESGKPTAQIGKALHVITNLGVCLLASADWMRGGVQDD